MRGKFIIHQMLVYRPINIHFWDGESRNKLELSKTATGRMEGKIVVKVIKSHKQIILTTHMKLTFDLFLFAAADSGKQVGLLLTRR